MRVLAVTLACGAMLPLATASAQTGPSTKPIAVTKTATASAVATKNTAAVLQQSVESFEAREKAAPAPVRSRLTVLRQEIQARKYTFEVGYTTALDVPLEVLAGTRLPANLKETARARTELGRRLLAIDNLERDRVLKINPNFHLPDLQIACNPQSSSFDWRRLGKVTSVKSQICGTCWDFTTLGAYEGSYAIRNNALVDTSEEYVLECAHAGSCGGGWWAFDFLIATGTASETAVPFTGAEGACPGGVSTPYRATAWGYVSADGGIPSVAQMKQALCEHGPLAVAVEATGAFQAYIGGVFNEHDTTHGINHGVTLIGWDDTKRAWVIKNSWGAGWGSNAGFGAAGQKGYMYISYDSNNIGTGAAWVQAQSRFYRITPDWQKLLELEKIRVKPLPDPEKLKELELHRLPG